MTSETSGAAPPPGENVIFVTWALHGTWPAKLLDLPPGKRDSSRALAAWDRELDRARRGPQWLGQPEVAGRVLARLKRGEAVARLYDVHAFVIMPNHMHLLLTPHASLAAITHFVKTNSARAANRFLSRAGSFWEPASFDHWIRDAEEFQRLKEYIERDPVRAGLVERADDWPYSSASRPPQKVPA